MSKSKTLARLYRFIWLLNPYRLFQGWCSLTSNNSQGQLSIIAAIREDKARDEAELKEFWTIDGKTLFPPVRKKSGK